jgi:prepilin signal peptidase PulO-like enzyme (type II secretory pathway)
MIVLMLAALGLILGSFVNAFVWRLHERKNWLNDRSECTHCHHKLAVLDLIPVLSWVLLRGKCRYCHEKIEDTPLTELALPVLFVVSYLYWPTTFEGRGLIEFMFWLAFLVGFLALTLYDLRWFLLPNKIVFPLIGLAIVQVVVVTINQDNLHIALSAATGALAIAGTFYLIFQLSGGTWIGGGDVKLGVVLGLLAGGVLEASMVLFFASVAGLLASLPLIIKGKAKRKMQIPFGPFLMVGLFVVVLFGAGIIDWYSGLVYG